MSHPFGSHNREKRKFYSAGADEVAGGGWGVGEGDLAGASLKSAHFAVYDSSRMRRSRLSYRTSDRVPRSQ